MKIALIYTRCRQTTAQALNNPQGSHLQKSHLQSHCQQNGIAILEAFQDIGNLENEDSKPGLESLIQFAEAHNQWVDLVLVTSWDRLSRSLAKIINLRSKLQNYGITVQAIDQPHPICDLVLLDSEIFPLIPQIK